MVDLQRQGSVLLLLVGQLTLEALDLVQVVSLELAGSKVASTVSKKFCFGMLGQKVAPLNSYQQSPCQRR